MRLTAKSGLDLEIRVITPHLTDKKRILIEMADDRTIAQIAAQMEGHSELRAQRADEDGVYEMYEGFTSVVAVSRTASGTVRVTLAREE